jgi:hypothetical protein
MDAGFKGMVVVALLAGGAAFAAPPPEAGESCLKSDGVSGCEGTNAEGVTAICDVNGNVPGSSCSETDPQTCRCYYAECLSAETCPANHECNTMTWKCEPLSSGGGSGVSSCSSVPGSAGWSLLPALFGLAFRRGRAKGKA